jgi:hypothetical protein
MQAISAVWSGAKVRCGALAGFRPLKAACDVTASGNQIGREGFEAKNVAFGGFVEIEIDFHFFKIDSLKMFI